MMIYLLPMEFEGSLLQSRIVGIGALVLDCTLCESVIAQNIRRIYNPYSQYFIVATSDEVVSFDGPAKTPKTPMLEGAIYK
jgi:hypothetical protein